MLALINQMSSNSEVAALHEFLNEHKTNGKACTHTRMSGGKFIIPPNKLDRLYQLLGKVVAAGNLFDLVERHVEVGPIYIDIDLKHPYELINRQYTQHHILRIVGAYNEVLTDLLDVSRDKLISVVATRESPIVNHKKRRISDGIHIYYPLIVTQPETQLMIRDEVMNRLAPIFDELTLTNKRLNPETGEEYAPGTGAAYEDVVDKSVISSNGVLMYGCTKMGQDLGNPKPTDLSPYVVQIVFDIDGISMPIESLPLDGCLNLQEFLSIQRFSDTDLVPLTATGAEKVVEYSVPKHQPAGETLEFDAHPLRKIDYEIQDIIKLTSMFNIQRWDAYDLWSRIGWALHNIDPQSPELFQLFKKGSAQSPKFEEGCCERLWSEARHNGTTGVRGSLLGMGSLHVWAKEDNQKAYFGWKSSKIRPALEDSLAGQTTHFQVAKVVQRIFKDEYCCVDTKASGVWYAYRQHRWHLTSGGSSLKLKIPTMIADEYMRLIDEYNRRISEDQDLSTEEREDLLQKNVRITKTINDMENGPFVKHVMEWARDLFLDEHFVEKLDEKNKDLICFNNGVYDLAKGVFREGRADDYISLCTGVDYEPFDPTDPRANEIEVLLDSIFPDPEVKEYMDRVFASCLDGHVLEQKFRVLMGVGSNGKGILRKLVDLAFDDYCKTLKATVLTRKQGEAEGANSSIAQTKGARIVFFDEPDQGDKIHVGTMKHYSGGDPIKARLLYSLPFEFYPQFSMFLLTNIFPEVPADDMGTWRRMEPINFVNQFVEDEPTQPNQYKMDKELPKRLPALAPVFIARLIEKYKVYRAEGIIIPKAVRDFKRVYQRSVDLVMDFLDRVISNIENPDCKISMDDLYTEFRIWTKSNGHTSKAKDINSKVFKEYLCKQYKQGVVGNDLIGVKYTTGYLTGKTYAPSSTPHSQMNNVFRASA